MKRLAKIVVMLVVYLVWVFGNSVIALSCHANHDKHIHCCAKSCDCHHEGWEKVHFESPHACNHDHSNKITLYDTTKEKKADIEPVVSTTHFYLATAHSSLLTTYYSLLTTHYCEHSEPLPPSPTLSGCGMRAPPVVA